MTHETHLCLSAHDELYLIDLDKVLYLQADDHYTDVHYVTGTHFLVPFGLIRIEALLATTDSDRFCLQRLGRKYIVNMRRIFRINTVRETLSLVDDLGSNISLHIPKPILRSLIDNMKNPSHEDNLS